MANFGVFLRTITRLDPIPGADRIELATVDGYQCVVGKGTYNVHDKVLYFPEGSVLPPVLIERLGLEGKLAGPQKDRVKAIKLRGQLSQGVILRDPLAIRDDGFDFAPQFGVTKYEPPVPTNFAGSLTATGGMLEPWIEIDAVKGMRSFDPDGQVWRDPFDHHQVEATLKLHGTAFACTMHDDGQFFVSSKGLGKKGLAIEEDESNVYWRAVKAFSIRECLSAFLNSLRVEGTISLYGEVFGPGVQDLTYGATTLQFRAFDVKINRQWKNPATARYICEQYGIPFVPALYIGPYNYERLVDLAENLPSEIDGLTSQIQEGIVVRTTHGERQIGKIVSSHYLTRKGGTEYN